MPKWFDLGKDDVKLRFFVHETVANKQEWFLVLMGLEINSPEWLRCVSKDLGFKPSPSGKPVLVRAFTASQLKLSTLQKAFPNARQIEVAKSDDVRLKLDRPATMTPLEMAIAGAIKVATPLGTNAVGHSVFETSAGSRFAVDDRGERIAEDKLPPALCLRANETNLASCAQGFVAGLMGRAQSGAQDVRRFVDILYGPGASQDNALVERVSQSIESEMTNRILGQHEIAGDAAYREAQALYENAPPHMGDSKGAGAVPLPASVAVQEIIRAYGGEDGTGVYVPRLYDGALSAMLGPKYVTFTEKVAPSSREGQMRLLIPSTVNLVERELNESLPRHAVSILNVENSDDVTLSRIRTELKARQPIGMSVILVPDHAEGASDEEKTGAKTRMSEFIRTIQVDYKVMGMGVLSPIMRRKMGLTSGLNMIALGHRYNPQQKLARGNDYVPAHVSTMYDWDALRTFTNDVLVHAHEEAGRRMTQEEENELRSNEAHENSYQLPYQSFSQNGDVELMIPRNLAGPTYKALQRLQDKVGDLDAFVKNATGLTDEQFAYLAPEQVDAGALMISALDRGKGLVLGDQTGAGKGITIALGLAWAWEKGLPVVFCTKQDNLFSDFYRDLKKIGLHENMRPLVLNHSSKIVDQFSENLDLIASGVSRKEFLQNYRFGLNGFDNPNIIFTTYSQFKDGGESEKSDFIKSIAPQCLVIFDESHMAAGDTSNMGEVCTDVADIARGRVASSATWLKDERQMRFYQSFLPESIDSKMVSDAMKAGGESIQEVFTAMLAEDGLFIRRERDSSEIAIESVIDHERLKANEGIANDVSLILQGLQRLCGVTDQVGRRLTRTQVGKLDGARKYIDAALTSIKNDLKDMRNAPRQAARAGENDAQDVGFVEAEEGAYDIAEQQVRALVGADAAQEVIDQTQQMREQASDDNDTFIAEGQGLTVFNAATVDNADRIADPDDELYDDMQDLAAQLQSYDRLTLADLGISDELGRLATRDFDDIDGGKDASARLKKELNRIQKLISGISTRTTSFGSFLFLTQRTLNVSLQARFAAQRAIEKIREGKKPIIFLEQTFEGRIAEQLESPDAIKNEDGTISIKPVTLKDNLRDMYRGIVNISHTNAEGERIEGSIMDERFMANPEERQVVMEGLQTLEDLIDSLPDDLYCSPIDTICNEIRKAGYTVGEATGRKYHVVDMTDGIWKVAVRSKKQSSISYIERGFNFGEFDALVGNKAMSTGMSVHSSKDFSDTRQRCTLFTQLFADVNDYLQAIGRADRRGQVIPPEVEMLASGLPSESRTMMNHYDKLRKLLASTTSNRSSKYEQQELPDLFNSVGDISVRDFLQANPGIATRLGIDFSAFMPSAIRPDGMELEVQTRGLAKYTVSRLDLLPVAESRAVYQEIAYNFAEVMADLDAQGINPLRTNVIDLTQYSSALVQASEDLLPPRLNHMGEAASVFDEAVVLETVVIKDRIAARSWEEALADIEESTSRMFLESVAQRGAGKTPDFVRDAEIHAIHSSKVNQQGPLMQAVKMVPAGLRDRVTSMFDAMQVMMRSSNAARATAGEVPLAVATEAAGPTAVPADNPEPPARDSQGNKLVTPAEVITRRHDWLQRKLQYLMPGQFVSIAFHNHNWSSWTTFRGVVTSITLPPRGRETNLSRWAVTIQCRGYTHPFRYTLQDLYRADFHGADSWLPAAETIKDGLFERTVADDFNNYREVDRKEHRYVLSGNLFRAASIAAEHRMGAGGVLRLKNEAPRRIISVRNGLSKNDIYASVPVELTPDQAVNLFVSTWKTLNRPPEKNVEYFTQFLKKGIDARAIHSAKESKDALVSIYWLAAKSGFISSLEEEMTPEERVDAQQEREEGEASGRSDLLKGVGIRMAKQMMTIEEFDRFIDDINTEIGYDAVTVARGRPGAKTTRVIVRFNDKDGNRDTDEAIRHKLAIVSRRASILLDKVTFYTHSPEMRLFALFISTEARKESRELRDAADDARSQGMRALVARSNFSDTPDNDEWRLENGMAVETDVVDPADELRQTGT
jgi:hypothetical protein